MIPIAKNMTLKIMKVSIVLMAVGTGLHAGKVYCLNFDFLRFSIFSLIFYFSSYETSISIFL
jgi:hypothetical protein